MGKTNESKGGRLYAEYWVNCADCRDCYPIGEVWRKDAERVLRKLGWKKTRRGYVCPACYAARG